MAKTPLAFLSYAHSDDEHENGRLREFAARLRGEVRLHWGEDFPIFIDRNDLKWGQEWNARLEESLSSVTFLIPILTPGYFRSDYCRKELKSFLDREAQLERKDLVLPVYYVRCPILEDQTRRSKDGLAEVLHTRQYADWRDLRHDPWTNPEVSRRLERIALQIVDVLERGGIPHPTPPAPAPGLTTASRDSRPTIEAEKGPAPKEPHTVIVDAMHRGDYLTISEAVAKEKDGTRILVRPGLYRESLVIEKVLEIIGQGDREDVVIESAAGNVVQFRASMGRIANLTLRQKGGDKNYGVKISSGRLDLEDCDITSRSLAPVAIMGGAEPRIRRSRIHHSAQSGIFVKQNGSGLIEENEIFESALCGIQLWENANPTIRKNRIHRSRQGGIVAGENAAGLIEENDIFEAGYGGIGIKLNGNPTIRRNRIYHCEESGIFVYEGGRGLIEDNEIYSNGYSGIEVKENGDPIVRSNRIRGNREGVRVYDGGKGAFEHNTFSGNKDGAWDIAADCLANVKRSGNIED